MIPSKKHFHFLISPKHLSFFITEVFVCFGSISKAFAASPATPSASPATPDINIKLFNPLGESSIYDIANAILDILMVFAVPIILFFIVWAGFLYVTAGGNQDQISKATKALMYAVIGGVIVLGAKVLLEVITNTVNVFG